MPNLSISTGLQEYTLNEKCKIYFNPTDPNFIEKIFDVFDTLDSKTEEYRREIQKEENGAKLFEIARNMDAQMREMIDDVLGEDVCQQLFGNISVYAASDGLPLWANLLLAIFDEMDDAFAREKKATNPRLKKYTAKFTKK